MTDSAAPARADDAPYGYEIVVAGTFEAVLDARRDVTSRSGPGAASSVGPGGGVGAGGGPDLGVEGLAEALQRWACVLMQARGGAGKTYTAERVREVLLREGVWSVLVPATALVDADDLALWNTSRWAMADPVYVETVGSAGTESLAAVGRGVVVIDGLNEVDRSIGERILASVGPTTAGDPQVSFLVTDRLTRRAGMSRHWRYATLGPVPPETVREIAGPDAPDALSIPYYLRRHSQGDAPQEILRGSIQRYVTDETGLARIAVAAYDAYKVLKRRSVTGDAVRDAVGQPVFDDMVAGRCLVRESPAVAPHAQGFGTAAVDESAGPGPVEYRFEHHLLHDYLAGRHLAGDSTLWNVNGFDTVTLKASSFDALALSLAELTSSGDAELLVQSVYNWNYYAAAYMIEEDRLGSGVAGDALAVALLAALADKRFDGVVPTVERVEDALRVNQTPLAGMLLAAEDRDAAVAVVVAHLPTRRPEWFDEWFDQFSRPDGTPARLSDVEAVTSTHPVLGWGAANALRRLDISDTRTATALRELLKDRDETVRWRAAHALGPHSAPANLFALQTAFADADADSWVAYGELRAQFEQASHATDQSRGDIILSVLESTRTALVVSPLLRAEAVRCLEVKPLPMGWHQQIEPVLDYLWQVADDRGAADLAALASRLRERKREGTDAA